jgi:hypothetical protein
MRKIFITLLLLIATLVACGQNTFRYVINANGGIAITAPLSIGGIIINSTGAELNILHDVPVSVTAVKLGYIGNVTSDIQTQLNSKQATLVSGTNIKSVGGVSLLGAGDIAVVGTGTVTSVAVTTAGGISGTVATSTTTPNITLTLGAITPASVAATGTVTGSNLSGTNTGDNSANTLYSGLVTNATHTGDVTGSGALTIATGAVTLAKMANMATGSLIYRKTALAGAPEINSLATLKTDLGLVGSNTGDQTNISGNAGTATKLYATKTINGVAFDGSANISVPSNITPSTSGNLMISNGSVWTSGTKASQGIITASDTATMLLPYTRVADSINLWAALDTSLVLATKYDLDTIWGNTVELSTVELATADSVPGSGHYASNYDMTNGLALKQNLVPIKKMQFRVDNTLNAPLVGDSILTQYWFIGKHIEVYRGGELQIQNTTGVPNITDGIRFDSLSGQIIFRPVLATNEKIIIELYDPPTWEALAIIAPQNKVKYSETLGNAVWDGGDCSVTASNSEVDLEGNTTMETITTTGNFHSFYYADGTNYVTVVPLTTYRLSFDVKRGSMTDLKWRVFDNTNSLDIVAYTTYYSQTSASETRRLSLSFTTPAGCTQIIPYLLSSSGVTGTVYLGRVQVEENHSNYVETTTTIL